MSPALVVAEQHLRAEKVTDLQSQGQAEEFWRRTITWTRRPGNRLHVREIDRLAEYLRLIRNGQRADWDQRRLDPIPTVSVSGDVVLLSPELADTDGAP